MTTEAVRKEIEKQQRAKMRQIISRRIKIAQLNAEVEQLQAELVEIPSTVAEWKMLREVEAELELTLDGEVEL